MTQRRSHDYDMPYQEQSLGVLTAPAFSQRPSADGGGIIVAGPCPRCHGRTETEFRRGAPVIGSKGVVDWLIGQRGVADEPEPLVGEVHFCECGHAHPQLPMDVAFVGCGASWRIHP